MRFAAASGLSLCMLFNLFFVLNVVAILGFTNWLVALHDASYAPLLALAVLWLANLWYAFARAPKRPARPVPAKLALWYFLASFVTLIASFALLVMLVPPTRPRVHV